MTTKAVEILIAVALTTTATGCGSSPADSSSNPPVSSGGGSSSTTAVNPGSGGSNGSSNPSGSGGNVGTTSGSTAGGSAATGGNATNGGNSQGSGGAATGGANSSGASSIVGGKSGTGGQSTTVAQGGQTTTTAQGGQTNTGGTVARGGQSGAAGQSGSAGQTATGGAPWAPSTACVQKATTFVDSLTLAQRIGQMTQVDSADLSAAEVTSGYLGSVLSGGGTDPAGGNKISDWSALISSYLNAAKNLSPHVGLLYGLDSVHGNNNVQDSVMFPHNIGLGASRNVKLVEDVNRITALEMLGVGANWAFHPTVAAALDERWGRTYESFSETPDLAGELGRAAVVGLQNGKLGGKPSVLACAKHYAGDGATDNGKNSGNVTTLDEATFRKLAIEPYRASIEAGVGSIMVSYSSYQGAKMTSAKKWLTDVLKGELGFQGFLVSDWDAVFELTGTTSDQLKSAVMAGIDMIMLSSGYSGHTAAEVSSTLSSLAGSDAALADRIKDAARRIVTIKCEMGLLDGDTTIDSTLTSAIGSAEHRAVARDAVRQSMVLLKNDGLLPLSKSLTRIHVTGSGADSLSKQCGGWTVGWQGLTGPGTPTGSVTGTTLLAAVKKKLQGGSTTVTSSTDGSGAAGADRAIVVVGETPYAEGQGDKANPTLTAADFAAIAAVKAANVPFVVVLYSGRPLILSDANGVSAIDTSNAFVAAWLPGTEGDGIADVLFGDYKPTGKLSFSWPATLSQIPINVGDGKTPLFPFGHGLTYP